MLEFNSLEKVLDVLWNTFVGQSIMNMEIVKILKQEAERLEQYIKEEINNYYNSYEPKEYERTYNWLKSLRIDEPKPNSDGTVSMEIYFDQDLAYHPSVMGKDQPMGYVPWLLEVGWSIEEKVGFSRPMFTSHPGSRYIAKAVQRFNENNPHGLKVMVFHGDERYL